MTLPRKSLLPPGQGYPLLLRENSILEGVGDHWGLGFAPIAPLMYPSGIIHFLPYSSISRANVLCTNSLTQRGVGSMERVPPEHVPFSVPLLFSILPTFPCSSSIPLCYERWVTYEGMEAGYTMGPSSGGQAAMGARSLRQKSGAGTVFNNYCLHNWIFTCKRIQLDPFPHIIVKN